MAASTSKTMVATLGGLAALLVGLAILLLPLLATELSRPRDSAWGAVMLLLGLVVVSSRDRLTGAPMLAVLCGGLLIGRLATEVGQGRWRQLTGDEQTRLGSIERWSSSLHQLGATTAKLSSLVGTAARGLGGWIGAQRQPKTTTKLWIRPEAPPLGIPTVVVSSLVEVEALIQAADDNRAG
jgi:hypothetical protein